MRASICLVAFLVSVNDLVMAQGAPATVRPVFEVASIKRNTTGDQTGFATPQPGRFTVVNVPLRPLIIRAYRLQPFQLVGGDGWLDSERFDVTAIAGGNVAPADMDLMLQSLLEDRFGLVVHRETRELPVYHLVTARDNGQPGPGLKQAAADCGPAGRGAPAAGPAGPQTLPPGFSSGVVTGCRSLRTPGWIMAAGQPMANVAAALTPLMGSPVIDRTGLAGNFDFSLSFMPDGRGPTAPPLPAEFPPIAADAPSLATALQEQLGLKLESRRGPVEVVIIDRAQRPTEN